MPLRVGDLQEGTYFVSQKSAVLYELEILQDAENNTKRKAVNHLLLGDWLKYLGETHIHKWKTSQGVSKSQIYARVKCRGDDGWLKLGDFDAERALEVNFVDIGQGDGCHIVTPDDEVLLIDAGEGNNMNRFLSWRYNLLHRNVKRADDYDPDKPKTSDPWVIDYVVMSHPDLDHYGGFKDVFANMKLSFNKVYHNGIVERPKESPVPGVSYKPARDDLGGYFKADGQEYLYDYVTTSSALKALVKKHAGTSKKLISTYHRLLLNTKNASFGTVGVKINSLDNTTYLPNFEEDKKFSLQILGPIIERKKFKNKHRTTVRKLGAEGITKNGHSVIFKARYNKLTLLLGGDLNTQSQNFLLQSYAKTNHSPEKIQTTLAKLRKKKHPLKPRDQIKLSFYQDEEQKIHRAGTDIFKVDVAKACHHGSQHVLDSFIKVVNATATVISSGDMESHSHPRPDALGVYGKFGRGTRPLIFSTELARSTREFTPQIKSYMALRGITLQIEAETDERKKNQLLKELEAKKERNVAVYGMITLRALGEKVIIAQKLEEPRTQSQKWDIYELHFDEDEGHYIYDDH